MQQLNEIIEINRKFQKSINIRLDYNKKEKITSYIPTRASVQVLKVYLQQFVKEQGMKSTILVGPYGKGKSHLLLILLALLSKKNQASHTPKTKQMLEEVIRKISAVDKEAGEYAGYLVENQCCYLPVIVSGVQSDLSRALLLALKEALVREGLEHMVPDTYFEEAKKTITQWKECYPATYQEFLVHLKKAQISEQGFLRGLESYEKETLEYFQKIYPALTAGSVFEPMVQMDLLTLFSSVNEVLCKEYHYQGIILIFDEFSKFVEGYPRERFSSAMEELQNICELANHSQKEKLHVMLVAHKAIKEYKNYLPAEVVNAYVGVEGRINEIYFTSSLKNSYELIQNVIVKDKEAFQTQIVATQKFQDMQESSYKLPYFQALFGKKEFQEIVAQGCFPMTPVAAYLLLKISEKAVQNERTVFTFLSHDEPDSLVQFLEGEQAFVGNYVTAGQVYDYFSNVLKNDKTDSAMHNEWLKAEYALKDQQSPQQKDVIKTIALLRMVGKQDEMYARDEIIRIGAGLTQESYEQAIEQLKQQQVVLFRSKTGSYAFKNNIGVDLEKEINVVVQNKLQKINVCQELFKLSELTYELPKRYNFEYTMTRYFQYEFMTIENFLNLKATDYLFQERFADGKIIAFIQEEELSVKEKKAVLEQVSSHLEQLNDPRVVIIFPKAAFEQTEMVKRILAIDMLKRSEDFLEQNKALEKELILSQEDLLFELNVWLEQYFMPLYGKCIVLHQGKQYPAETFYQKKSDSKFNQFLSNILEEYYCYSPKINNELINKRILTAQTKKARRKLMEQLLAGEDFQGYQKGTSPEATIFRAVFMKTGVLKNQEPQVVIESGVKQILTAIDEFIQSAAGVKQSFAALYEKLQGKQFGMRTGVLPLYLTYCISYWENTPIISLGDKEVQISPQIFENINQSPEEYYLYMEQESLEKEQYLKGLESKFLGGNKRNYAEEKFQRLQRISDGMYGWFCSLPQCARNYMPEGKTSQQQKGIQKFKVLFSKQERNPRQVLMESLLQAFEASSYEKLLQEISSFKEELDFYMTSLAKQAVSVTKEVFDFSKEDDLKQSLKSWYQTQRNNMGSYVHSRQVSTLMNCIETLDTHDEKEIVEQLSKAVLDLFLEDWKENSLQQYRENLCSIKQQIEETQEENITGVINRIIFTNSHGKEIERHFQMEEEDGTSELLQNEIESALEDYGDCLETNQKISVMVRMIEKLLEG